MTSTKTPISHLQEHCQLIGKTPQYDLIAVEGRAHQPQFVYKCTVGVEERQGQGGSKKSAKHNAAESMLRALKAPTEIETAKQTNDVFQTQKAYEDMIANDDGVNPVGALQELVVSKGWRLPEYTLHAESGPAHKKEFIMKCTVETFNVTGSGSAKKVAKRKAANAMHNKLMNLPPDAKSFIEADINANKVISFDILKDFEGMEINNKINIKSEKNCIALKNVAAELNFIVQYCDIDQNTESGDRQCLVLLKTQPQLVVHGIGRLLSDAHAAAARNAINMLHIFAKNKKANNLENS